MEALHVFLHVIYDISLQDYPSIAKEIRQFYFGNRNISQSIQEFSELTSDAFISYGTHVAAREQATISSGKTFYYV